MGKKEVKTDIRVKRVKYNLYSINVIQNQEVDARKLYMRLSQLMQQRRNMIQMKTDDKKFLRASKIDQLISLFTQKLEQEKANRKQRVNLLGIDMDNLSKEEFQIRALMNHVKRDIDKEDKEIRGKQNDKSRPSKHKQ